VRLVARDYLVFAALAPLIGAAAFAFDGIYAGATWTRTQRDLMVAALVAFGVALLVLHGFGNAGLWLAFLAFLGARAAGQALLYPHLAAATFPRPRPALAQ
jgi:MATE family multidrug resistance protein